jgi:hypothetical protein
MRFLLKFSESVPREIGKMAYLSAKKLGEKIVDCIGHGNFGYIFSLKSDRVLKITKDKIEINLIYNLFKLSSIPKSLMTYYNIGHIKDTQYYYILMDYVEPLTKYEKDCIYFFRYKIQYNRNYYKEIMSPKIEKEIKEDSVDKREEKTLMMFLPYIREIVKDLKKYKIEETDFHGGNLGWNKDHTRLIMFDLGGLVHSEPRDKTYRIKSEVLEKKTLSDSEKRELWIEQIAHELGEEIKSYIGAGSFGFAYETESGKILKITTDPVEIRLAYRLSKNRNWTRYLINYYNVGKTNKKLVCDGEKIKAYYVLMDKVEPIENTDVGDAIDKVYQGLIQYKEDYYENIADKSKVKRKINEMISMIGKRGEELAKIAEEIYPQILNICKELRAHHIVATDFHSGNIGWTDDESRLVLYDLGGYVDKSTGIIIKNRLKKINVYSKRKKIELKEKLITKFSNYDNQF